MENLTNRRWVASVWRMSKAGIDVLSHGTVVLEHHSDPALQGKFAYSAFDGGFELRSTCSIPTRLLTGQALDFGLRKNLSKVTDPRQ